jgi:hypothetical protein
MVHLFIRISNAAAAWVWKVQLSDDLDH